MFMVFIGALLTQVCLVSIKSTDCIFLSYVNIRLKHTHTQNKVFKDAKISSKKLFFLEEIF